MSHAIMIVASLLFSVLVSSQVLRATGNKRVAMLSACLINLLFLGAIAWGSYLLDAEARLFGSSGRKQYILVIAIPFVSWVSLLVLQLTARKWVPSER